MGKTQSYKNINTTKGNIMVESGRRIELSTGIEINDLCEVNVQTFKDGIVRFTANKNENINRVEMSLFDFREFMGTNDIHIKNEEHVYLIVEYLKTGQIKQK